MEPLLAALLPYDVVIESYQGEDAWGNRVYASGRSYRGQITAKSRELIGKAGETVVSRSTVYLDCTDLITTLDRVTLPELFSPRQPNILEVRRISDERGLHHTMLLC